MKIYLAMVCDRHVDLQAHPFSTPEAAVGYARRVYEDYRPADLTEEEAADAEVGEHEPPPDGWLYSATYSTEGDGVGCGEDLGRTGGHVSSEIVEFIRARLAEQEREVEGSGNLGWLTYRDPDGSMGYTTAASTWNGEDWVVDGKEAAGYASAVVVHREADRMADIAAKRQILAQYEEVCERVRNPVSADSRAAARVGQFELEQVLLALARSSAGHPDFRPEWKL